MKLHTWSNGLFANLFQLAPYAYTIGGKSVLPVNVIYIFGTCLISSILNTLDLITININYKGHNILWLF